MKNLVTVIAVLLAFPYLSSAQQACTTMEKHALAKRSIPLTQIDSSKSRGLADNYYLWNPAEVITVKFLSGSKKMQDQVKAFASEWLRYANVKFKYVTTGPATVRILLGRGRGHNSFIGTVSKMIEPTEETMNLDTSDFITTLSMRGTVLHEFGHMLGLLHEHSNPISGIKWNKDSIYKVYWKRYGWDKEQVDYQVFRTFNYSYTNGTNYDRQSIMHYSIEPWETINGYNVPWNYFLSPGDKILIAALYPKGRVRKNDVPRVNITNFKKMAIQDNKVKGGLSLFPTFDLAASGKRGRAYLLAEFFDNYGYAIEDTDGNYSFENRVAAFKSITTIPGKKISYNKLKKDLEIFIPYEQLELQDDQELAFIRFRVVLETDEGEIKDIFYGNPASFSFSKKK